MVGEIYMCILFVWSMCCVSCLSRLGVTYMSCLSGLPFFLSYVLHSYVVCYAHVFHACIGIARRERGLDKPPFPYSKAMH